MSVNIFFVIAAYVLELLDLLWFFIRIKKHGSKDKSLFTKSLILKLVCIYACVIIIPALCIFINFGSTGSAVLCGCAVLGLEVINRDLIAQEDSEE